jgi:hypothetical protein
MTGRRTKVIWIRYEGGPLDGHREIRHDAMCGQPLLARTPVGNPATMEAVHEYAMTFREWRTPPGEFPTGRATIAVFVRTVGERPVPTGSAMVTPSCTQARPAPRGTS